MDRYRQSYNILEKLRLNNGMYLASASQDYHFVWLRDSFYEVLPYLHIDNDYYEKTYHRILDYFKEYRWKIELHTKKKPVEDWEYIHIRFDAENIREIDMPWGHAQHDAIGAVLYGISLGVKNNRPIIRNNEDLEIIQLIVDYLECCEYWQDKDSGMWEENREVHSSSVGAVVASLQALKQQGLAIVKDELINKGWETINNLFPFESETKPVDLAQLSLIYPYGIYTGEKAEVVMKRVEQMLLRDRGVLRYQGDSYYSTKEHLGRHLPYIQYYGTEAEWTFGLPWLCICHTLMGNGAKAREYLNWTESIMLEDGSLPELYYSNSERYNVNTPLGWSNAMYIQAVDMVNSAITDIHTNKIA